MIQNIYSIYDSVAKIFNRPFTSINNDTAIREFKSSLQDNPHANDYSLYHLATFDDLPGDIKPNLPVKILTGFDVTGNIGDKNEEAIKTVDAKPRS